MRPASVRALFLIAAPSWQSTCGAISLIFIKRKAEEQKKQKKNRENENRVTVGKNGAVVAEPGRAGGRELGDWTSRVGEEEGEEEGDGV